MARSEYMRLKLRNLPKILVQQYNIEENSTKDGYVHVYIKRGMYGILKEGIISQQLLEKWLNKKGYQQSEITLGFWTQDCRPICFSIYVDNFCVKYVGKQHAEHLNKILREY